MKKIFMILVILFMLYFGIQIGYSFFGSGHQAEYSVKTEEKNFLVKETFSNKKNDIKSYYFEINYDNDIFYYQTTADFKKSNEIIKNIYYYGDNMYSCIFPIFEDNKIISDVICKNNDILYNYHNISGKDKDLDNFILNLQEKGYNASNFVDNDLNFAYNSSAAALFHVSSVFTFCIFCSTSASISFILLAELFSESAV